MATTALRPHPQATRTRTGNLVFTNGDVTWEVTPLGSLLMNDAAGTTAVLDIPFEVTADGAVLVFVDGGETHIVYKGDETVVSTWL
jgi:hypothetical protein